MIGDARLAAISAAFGIDDSPEARSICERFAASAAALNGPASGTCPCRSRGFKAALQGMAEGLAIAADHAEFMAEYMRRTITPPPPA